MIIDGTGFDPYWAKAHTVEEFVKEYSGDGYVFAFDWQDREKRLRDAHEQLTKVKDAKKDDIIVVPMASTLIEDPEITKGKGKKKSQA